MAKRLPAPIIARLPRRVNGRLPGIAPFFAISGLVSVRVHGGRHAQRAWQRWVEAIDKLGALLYNSTANAY
jgi:hypothetical protein